MWMNRSYCPTRDPRIWLRRTGAWQNSTAILLNLARCSHLVLPNHSYFYSSDATRFLYMALTWSPDFLFFWWTDIVPCKAVILSRGTGICWLESIWRLETGNSRSKTFPFSPGIKKETWSAHCLALLLIYFIQSILVRIQENYNLRERLASCCQPHHRAFLKESQKSSELLKQV